MCSYLNRELVAELLMVKKFLEGTLSRLTSFKHYVDNATGSSPLKLTYNYAIWHNTGLQ